MQFINVQVQYFGETKDRDFQITKKINIWRFMLFKFIIIRQTSEKICEQAKKSILKKLLGRKWPSYTVGYLLSIGLAEKVEAIWSV